MGSTSPIYFIVSKDVVRAKQLTFAVRESGGTSYFFDQWNDFWVQARNESPQYIILDVEVWAKEGQLLPQNPAILEKKSQVIFDCPHGDEVLLRKAPQFYFLGALFGQIGLSSQLKSILSHSNQVIDLLKKDLESKQQISTLTVKNRFLHNNKGDQESFIFYHKELVKIAKRVAKEDLADSFGRALGKGLQEWSNIAQFSGYELSSSKNKLMPLDVPEKNYAPFPSLWLGQVCSDGIDKFALEMASQVAIDTMGKQVFTLKIYGRDKNPDFILFVTLKEQYNYFQWGLLEELLSSSYRQYLLGKERPEATEFSASMNSWEVLDLLEEWREVEIAQTHHMIDLSLSSLVKQSQVNTSNRFHWKNFKTDFEDKLLQLLGPTGRVCFFGVHHIVLLVDRTTIEAVAEQLKIFVTKFPFWRYFEDSGLVLSAEIAPTLRIIPPGAVAYLRFLERDFDGLESAISRASKKASYVLGRTHGPN